MVAGVPEPPTSAFAGVDSLRVRNERRTLWWTIAGIIAAAPVLAHFFPGLARAKEIALLIVGALVYVTFARGRLIGGSIRVHPGQFEHVYEIALECSRALRMSMPNVFIRDDPLVPVVAVGIGEPYSLIISAQWVEHLEPDELRFLIGRELAHIAAGHTRITSLLSVNGRENALVSIVFGAWLRRIEYTADRAGLLCCASLDGALSAIAISTFGLVGRRIDAAQFAEQQREIESERGLRIGEWISATPYAAKRIAALRGFARESLFLHWSARFEEYRVTPFVSPPLPIGATSRRAYADFPRRLAAFAIDVISIEILIPNLHRTVALGVSVRTDPDVPGWISELSNHAHAIHAVDGSNGWGWLIALAYYVLLVGLLGQTAGMMILDLRVVSDNFRRVGFGRAVLRVACLTGSLIGVIGWLRIFGRIQPFEHWSGTRLVGGATFLRSRERFTERSLDALAP